MDCDDINAAVNPDARSVLRCIDSDCDEGSDFDSDGDGYDAIAYGGDDCDDEDDSFYPGAYENYYDGLDANCDGLSDYDADGDGFDSSMHTPNGQDCDDTDPTINPNGVEIARDGIDQDCDGALEFDDDQDGYNGIEDGGDDCDDDDPTIFPTAVEIWYDGVDQDCLGNDDYDQDGDGHQSDQHGGDDCDDTLYSVHLVLLIIGTTVLIKIATVCLITIKMVMVSRLFMAGQIAMMIQPFYLLPEVYRDGVDQNCDGLSDHDAEEMVKMHWLTVVQIAMIPIHKWRRTLQRLFKMVSIKTVMVLMTSMKMLTACTLFKTVMIRTPQFTLAQ